MINFDEFETNKSHLPNLYNPVTKAGHSLQEIQIFPNLIDDELLESCVEDVEGLLLHNPSMLVYGKECKQNRDVGFFSNVSTGYKYSGQIMTSIKLTQNLQSLLDEINQIFPSSFNGILVNHYATGVDYIGAHSDDERGLDPNCGVVAVSYGAPRIFRIRDKSDKKILCDIETANGQVIQMNGLCQKKYTHEIPQQKKITKPRWSFTFRKHVEDK